TGSGGTLIGKCHRRGGVKEARRLSAPANADRHSSSMVTVNTLPAFTAVWTTNASGREPQLYAADGWEYRVSTGRTGGGGFHVESTTRRSKSSKCGRRRFSWALGALSFLGRCASGPLRNSPCT